MKVVQTTDAAADSLAEIIDLAMGYPKRGAIIGGGSNPVPTTWDGRGNPPNGWTLTYTAIWRNNNNSAWLEISDATADIVAASPALTAGQKAEVSAVLPGRVTLTDPKEGAARKPRCTGATQVSVFCVGDSWTKGTNTVTPNFHTWRGVLQANAAAEPGFPKLNFVGAQKEGDTSDPESDGINASRMPQHNAVTLATNILYYSPDVVVMCLGINDADLGPIDQELFRQFWRDVHTARPASIKIWIIPPNVWGAGGIGPTLDAFRADVPGSVSVLAGEGIAVTVHDWTGVFSIPGDLTDGGNHPTAAGHDKLGDSLWPTFKAALGF